MIEIRPIQAGETSTFLRLLCDVFDLDFERAASVFMQDPLFDLDRKWALFDAKRMVSILTTTPLTFGWGKAIGIAGVATLPSDRGRGLGGQLLDAVLSAAEKANEGPALLFARETKLYERCGFTVIDHMVQGVLPGVGNEEPCVPLNREQLESIYTAWAAEDKDRLVRDAQRWGLWHWHLRAGTPAGIGYACWEGTHCREAIGLVAEDWQKQPSGVWSGLESMTAMLEIPTIAQRQDLMLMGRGFDRPPQMFMTDQF